VAAAQIVTTFTLTTFAWIFFRANNLEDAMIVVQEIFGDSHQGRAGIELDNVILGGAMIVVLEIAQILQRRFDRVDLVDQLPVVVRWAAYMVLINAIIWLGAFTHTPFIYFQF
jgi:hypothetical protein